MSALPLPSSSSELLHEIAQRYRKRAVLTGSETVFFEKLFQALLNENLDEFCILLTNSQEKTLLFMAAFSHTLNIFTGNHRTHWNSKEKALSLSVGTIENGSQGSRKILHNLVLDLGLGENKAWKFCFDNGSKSELSKSQVDPAEAFTKLASRCRANLQKMIAEEDFHRSTIFDVTPSLLLSYQRHRQFVEERLAFGQALVQARLRLRPLTYLYWLWLHRGELRRFGL